MVVLGHLNTCQAAVRIGAAADACKGKCMDVLWCGFTTQRLREGELRILCTERARYDSKVAYLDTDSRHLISAKGPY